MSDETNTDTSHLYEGKSVRSSAPSRKKAAGRVTQSTSIPKDAIPETKIPTWVESFFGGPLVPSVKFLSPNKTVVRLQMASVTTLVMLGLVTFVITPPPEPSGSGSRTLSEYLSSADLFTTSY